MSEYQILTVIAGFAFAYSLVASRLEKTPVNGALVYVAAGIIFGPHLLGLVDLQVDGEAISQLAEIALAICLFTDSSNANLSVLRRVEAIPIRLLAAFAA
jgi:NhaP-type Na+/H+ or K+/H+ antiporter